MLDVAFKWAITAPFPTLVRMLWTHTHTHTNVIRLFLKFIELALCELAVAGLCVSVCVMTNDWGQHAPMIIGHAHDSIPLVYFLSCCF